MGEIAGEPHDRHRRNAGHHHLDALVPERTRGEVADGEDLVAIIEGDDERPEPQTLAAADRFVILDVHRRSRVGILRALLAFLGHTGHLGGARGAGFGRPRSDGQDTVALAPTGVIACFRQVSNLNINY